MLVITIQGDEFFNEETQEFTTVGDTVLELEHSLVSLSKWESKYQKPFLDASSEKSSEEIMDYIKFMIITPGIDLNIVNSFTQENLNRINKYIESSESATTFGEMPATRGRGEVITAELIYYWMVAFTIPFECQYWHLNRLFALIRICNIKNDPKGSKKMTRHQTAQRNRELNRKRREQLGTTG